jgi:hypothetical protein
MTEYEYANHIRLLGRTIKFTNHILVWGTTQQCTSSNSKKYFENRMVHAPHHIKQKLLKVVLTILNFQTMVIEWEWNC